MSDITLEHFISDLGLLLKEQAHAAKANRDSSTADQRLFAQGQLFAYLEVLSLVQQELDSFGLSRAMMQLDDINPEQDLL